MTTTFDPYYIRPDLFQRKVKAPVLKTKEMICRFCALPYTAKYRWGQAPNYCSKSCIKKRAYQDHKVWKESNIQRFRELCRISKTRKLKRNYTRKKIKRTYAK